MPSIVGSDEGWRLPGAIPPGRATEKKRGSCHMAIMQGVAWAARSALSHCPWTLSAEHPSGLLGTLPGTLPAQLALSTMMCQPARS